MRFGSGSGESRPESARPRTAALAALPYALFLAMAGISWNRWIEPYVDSGRELATPLRLSRGERLYRDVRFYHGPLAPYVGAAIDRAAGPSLPARIGFAAAIALAHIEALRRLAARFLSPGRAAFVTALVVAAVFFLRPGGCHLFPFSFDTAIAAAGTAWAMALASGRQSRGGDVAAALALLAVLLSRPEMGVAAIAALAVERRRPGRLGTVALLPLGAAAAAYAALSVGTPFETLRGEGWLAVISPPASFRNVYASYAGLDRPALRLAELALAAVVLLVIAAFLALAASLAARAGRAGPFVEAAAVLALAAGSALCAFPSSDFATTLALFPPVVRVVPPLVLAGAAMRLGGRALGRKPRRLLQPVPDALLLIAALFGARVLLAGGYVGPYNAFLLPLPLVVGGVALFRGAEMLAPSIGSRLPRLLAAALAVFLAFRVVESVRVFRSPGWSRVRTPAGTVWLTEPVAGTTRSALADVAARVRPGGTLVGFPEAGFFEYVLDRRNPLPQEQFFPGHLDADAETRAIAELARRPPDVILYANVLAVGHRAVRFGTDYLTRLDAFVRGNFEVAASYGPGTGPGERIGDPQFFVEIRIPRSALHAEP